MSLTKTPICNFGEEAKDFKLVSTENKKVSLDDIKGKNGILIMFICNHCPYVKAVINKIVRDAKDLNNIGIQSAAIMSNNTDEYPEDSFENMKKFSKKYNFCFPYLYDETQEVAKQYDAVCTPDFFGFDKYKTLRYRGRIDNSGLKNEPNATRELYLSMKAIKDDKIIPFNNPSIGCSIKWKSTV